MVVSGYGLAGLCLSGMDYRVIEDWTRRAIGNTTLVYTLLLYLRSIVRALFLWRLLTATH